ncbi:MAG: amidase family protein [Acidimicrobiales bacterium]
MQHTPSVDEVVEVAESLGMSLSAEEAVVYHRKIAEMLSSLDTFVQARIPEEAPPMVSPSREPGYRPSSDEDPLAAWLWKCHIEGAADGVLAGKTVSYKDHTAVAGIPLTFGSFVMEGFIPNFDATIVTRVLEQGGTITGKNAMNGLSGGYGFGGGVGDYDRPRNPHNHEHVTGGSSSGSVIAVVTGEVDVSFGGDQGGSIRIPAAWSGSVGLKPTFGLVSHFGVGFGTDRSIDYVGPLARTAEDCARALDAVAGPDGYDPRQSRDVPASYDSLSTLTDGVEGLRIGVVDEAFIDAEPDVHDLVMAAIDELASAGAIVTKVSIPEHLTVEAAQMAMMVEGWKAVFDTGFFGSFTRTYYPADLIAAIATVTQTQPDLLAPRTKMNYILADFTQKAWRGRLYAKGQNVRPTYIAAYDRAFADVDVLAMPTCITTAPRYVEPETAMASLEDNLGYTLPTDRRHPWLSNTLPFNYTGHPALAVPCGKAGNGLPASMQLTGRFFEDATLLRAAHAYEKAVDWDQVIGIGT